MVKIGLLNHYRRLWFFSRNRFKDNNYPLMRQYLAEVFLAEIEDYMLLSNCRVLDVGGARGEFCAVLGEKRQCGCLNVDPSPGECVWPMTVMGVAKNLPLADNSFDLVICRGVLEHIPTADQQKSLDELHRVTRVGGLGYLMIPPWYNPHAGHHLKPFHVLPMRLAKCLKRLVSGRRTRSDFYQQVDLYPITYRKMVRMISASGFRLVAAKDTHLRLHFLTEIPLVREVAIPAVAFIVQKRQPDSVEV